jgi:hypothetical protein
MADTILAQTREQNKDARKMLDRITCQAGVVKFFMHAQGLDWSAPAIHDILRNWHDDESAVFVSKVGGAQQVVVFDADTGEQIYPKL